MNDAEKELATIQEKVSPRIYHIHIDTQSKNEETERFHVHARNRMGFFAHDFTGHPDGYVHFEPTMHSSIKISDEGVFNEVWAQLEEVFRKTKNVKGYLEGEFIPTDIVIPYKPLEVFKKPAFTIERRVLDESKGELFRETELHLCLDFGHSDRSVVNSLLDAGLYGALLKKPDYEMMVLTMQGHFRTIEPLRREIIRYLKEVGGVVRATIKEECALKNLRMNMAISELPEIADKVIFFT